MTDSVAGESKEVTLLLERARGWLEDAMDAWSEGEAGKVSALAPLAVEMALKALLWRVSPALLVPLDRQHEQSLIELATTAHLMSEKLRTVGLDDALKRAIAVADKEPPVDVSRRRRLVACRNGAIHVGAVQRDLSRHVLTDCIELLVWVIEELDKSAEEFFGQHLDDCRDLLTKGRSEMQEAVSAKLSKHRKQYERLVLSVDERVWPEMLEALEEAALSDRWITEPSSPDVIAAQQRCPACQCKGALYGAVSVDADADAEYEDGELVYYGYWIVTLVPGFFHCNVCRLRLHGPQELEPAGLPARPFEPEQDALGDFDPAEYAQYLDEQRD